MIASTFRTTWILFAALGLFAAHRAPSIDPVGLALDCGLVLYAVAVGWIAGMEHSHLMQLESQRQKARQEAVARESVKKAG